MAIDRIPNTDLSPAMLADYAAVIEHVRSGHALDPSVVTRIHDRAMKITDDIRRKHGELDVAVPAIRELRDVG